MIREVMKWNKNHITGEEVKVKCNKPDNGRIGKVNIKLFDDNGNVTNETFTENIIVDALNAGELYRQAFGLIAFGKLTPYGGNTTLGSFRNIVLATNSDEENKDELVCSTGSIIGWCPKKNTNAGSSVTRGVYNPNESYEKWENGYLHSHLVYDFGTSQGNGTFNSIWWSRDTAASDDEGTNIMPMFCAEVTFPIGGARQQSVKINGGSYHNQIFTGANGSYYWYDPVEKNYKKILNGDEYVQGVSDRVCTSKEEEMYSSFTDVPKSLNDIPNSDSKYVTLKHNYSKGSTATYLSTITLSLKDKTDSTIHESTIDFRNIPGVHTSMSISSAGSKIFYPRNIFQVLENGDVYIACYGDAGITSSSYYMFKTYDFNTDTLSSSNNKTTSYVLGVYNIFSKTWTLEPDFNNIDCMRINSCSSVVSVLGKIKIGSHDFYYRSNAKLPTLKIVKTSIPYYWDLKSYAINNTTAKYHSSADIFSYINGHIHGTTVLMVSYSSSSYVGTSDYDKIGGDLKYTYGYSAHTKLPNPVTKTSADTMKVTYDYYIQCPKFVSVDGNFLTFDKKE